MVKKDCGNVEKAHPHDVAIFALSAFDERERVAIEFRHHAHDEAAFRTGRTRSLRRVIGTFSDSSVHAISLLRSEIFKAVTAQTILSSAGAKYGIVGRAEITQPK